MYKCVAAMAASMSVLLGAEARAHHGGFEICNESSSVYYVSVAYRSGFGIFLDNWTLTGPFVINSKQCFPLFRPMSNALNLYIGVKSPGLLYGFREVQFTRADFRTSGRFGEVANVSLCTKDVSFETEGSLSFLSNCSNNSSLQSPSGNIMLGCRAYVA